MPKNKVRVDHTTFNAEYYANKTEQQFIDDQLASVPDHVGDDKQKTAWLKEAWPKVNPAAAKK